MLKQSAQRTIIWELRVKNGEVYSDNENLMHIMTDFYTELYTPSPVEESVQEKLSGNVDRTLSSPMLNLMPCFLMFLISIHHLNRKLFKQIISHMTKAVCKAIMRRSALENKFYKNKLLGTGILYKTPKNYTNKLIKKGKKYFSNLTMNNYTDNKKFWNKGKPPFSNYGGGSQKITLIDGYQISINHGSNKTEIVF